MSQPIDRRESVVRAWLAEGPDRGRPEALERALAATRRVPQRPGWSVPERWLPVNRTLSPVAPAYPKLAVAIVAMVVGLSVFALRIIPGPATQPTPSPTSQATTSTSTSFTSDLNAYSFELPAGWRAVPATEVWRPGERFVNGDARFMDVFVSSGGFGPM